MSIDAISIFDDSSDELGFQWTETTVWNGRQVTLNNEKKEESAPLFRNILGNSEKLHSETSYKTRGGSASVSVEKDSEGTAKIEIEVEVDISNSGFSATGSGSVDSNGKSTVEVEASFSW